MRRHLDELPQTGEIPFPHQYVIGQDDAKRNPAVRGLHHYKRIQNGDRCREFPPRYSRDMVSSSPSRNQPGSRGRPSAGKTTSRRHSRRVSTCPFATRTPRPLNRSAMS